jgi:hypothetical protein
METQSSRCPGISHLNVEEHAPNINEVHGPEVDVYAVGKLILKKLTEIQTRIPDNLQDSFKEIS